MIVDTSRKSGKGLNRRHIATGADLEHELREKALRDAPRNAFRRSAYQSWPSVLDQPNVMAIDVQSSDFWRTRVSDVLRVKDRIVIQIKAPSTYVGRLLLSRPAPQSPVSERFTKERSTPHNVAGEFVQWRFDASQASAAYGCV